MELNEEEKQKLTGCLDSYGIMDVDKLLALNDFKIIKAGFESYPIVAEEWMKKRVESKDYRTVFRFCVDYGFDELAKAMFLASPSETEIIGYLEENCRPAFAYRSTSKSSDFLLVGLRKYFQYKRRTSRGSITNDKYFFSYEAWSGRCVYPKADPDDFREKTLKNLSLKMDKETLTAGLTQDYFQGLLENGSIELLVIKLCVRLEAVFKCDYHYEGTFEEMMSKFNSAYGYEDDGYGYNQVESERTRIFVKLRKYRNDIVHAEKTASAMSKDELEKVIDYVIKLG